MSGHSKWATIHRQKEVKDAKKGQIFTKMANAITIAVRAGGGIGDIDKNFRLRLAVEKARAVNTPNENIQRAIRRGLGLEGGNAWEEVTYEGFGPGGVAVIVEAATDNKNRTGSLIRNLFEKGGGNMGVPGSVAFQFDKAARFELEKKSDFESQELELIDLGAIEIIDASDQVEVYFPVEKLGELKKVFEEKGWTVHGAEIGYRPKTVNKITELAVARKITNFIQAIEEQDDVQNVYSNFEVEACVADQLYHGSE